MFVCPVYSVECKPERIPDSVLDENVYVCLVHHSFSSDAMDAAGNSPLQEQNEEDSVDV